jgi:hypothetical protein
MTGRSPQTCAEWGGSGSVDDLETSARSRAVKYASAEEIEVGPAKSHAFEELDACHVALDLA